jgi:hypothetical protein
MRWLAAVLLCLIALSGSMPRARAPAEALPHDAYIWQRVWTAQVSSAVQRSSDMIRAWRVLLAESDRAGRWTSIAVPWREVRTTARPAVGVVRIDGRLDETRMPALLEQVVARVAASAPELAGVEIDYDCPTSKLPTYARFLAELRVRLDPRVTLSITALPTWMNSPSLEGLTRYLDEIVLQVHAADDPRRGLFDPGQAERWVREFSRRTRIPFRVAVPAYDVRVTWRADGRLASVEGEVPLLAGAANSELLGAAPSQVLDFLRALDRIAPAGLVGVVWFRLPTDGDARSWSLTTWRAVIAGALPEVRLRAALVQTERADVWTVTLSNDGPIDAVLPSQVRLDPACEMADGANGFRLRAAGSDLSRPLVLEAARADRLRANRDRIIGWARCPQLAQGRGKGLDVIQ